MVGWKPLLRQADAHTERFTERSDATSTCLCASLHVPSGSHQLSHPRRGRSQEPRGTGSIVPRYPLIKSHIPEISRQCTFPNRVDGRLLTYRENTGQMVRSSRTRLVESNDRR